MFSTFTTFIDMGNDAGTPDTNNGTVSTAAVTDTTNSGSSASGTATPCGCKHKKNEADMRVMMQMGKAIHILHLLLVLLIIWFIIHLIRKP